ncbi:hypothetical protein [Cyanobacterium aponinum]|uniref:hypothetical protein n=1 Tax=Cyanobacterium aponinum TaxID=379064 RepID=UPI000C12AFA7|nr:hypothetical protein [Cyanobacterium aponinum]PHV63194.1 hypothetical protein CSQ80_06575 [Cyanobacterium aponinum IPPAS B-1201]
MPDSVRLKEIHACLGAGEFSYYQNSNGDFQPYYEHLARKIDRIAKAIGIMFNPDGSIMSVRQSKHIPQGGIIPAGWNFAQFGSNTGASTVGQSGGNADEERLGIVYQVRSNQLIINNATGEPTEITQGGYVLCENWGQYFEVMLRDLDKAIDWQNLGAGLVNFNGKTLVVEGLFSFLQEICVVDADTNQTTEQTRISSLITQQLAKEILKAIGLPTQVKKFDFTLQSNDQTWQGVMGANKVTAEVPYNGVAEQSPTLVTLLVTLLENIAVGNIGKLQLNEKEAIKNNPPNEPDKEIIPPSGQYGVNIPPLIQSNTKQDPVLNRNLSP